MELTVPPQEKPGYGFLLAPRDATLPDPSASPEGAPIPAAGVMVSTGGQCMEVCDSVRVCVWECACACVRSALNWATTDQLAAGHCDAARCSSVDKR